ncbi:splicing regulator SDE2 isoform X2 [Boleophthalmus pectinirostris]|uniref:splicing regulator SDE2 isoform X2 n=1 Tax=Boleophthalmus pectinirostris TaxID=150288 RepID=UPI00242F452C|nr:splicing regulator SDE2 isoform X2 [Boleophthalmus pectinirostris]
MAEVWVTAPALGLRPRPVLGLSAAGQLLEHFQRNTGLCDLYVVCNGRVVDRDELLQNGSVYHLETRLRGGKGGFGSMLRALGAQIEKTTNREACRDLSGRRLRDVNHEKEMAEWLKKQAEREAEKEQRRLERLQKKLAEPKHHFTDAQYTQQCHELAERLEDSVIKGLQVSCGSGLGGSGLGGSGLGGSKRSSEETEGPVNKKSRSDAPFTWTGLDLSSDDDTDQESDLEQETLPSAPLPVSPSAPLPVSPSAPLPVSPSAPLPVSPSAPLPVSPSAPLSVSPSAPLPVLPSAPLPVSPSAPLPVSPSAPLPVLPSAPAPLPVLPSAPAPPCAPPSSWSSSIEVSQSEVRGPEQSGSSGSEVKPVPSEDRTKTTGPADPQPESRPSPPAESNCRPEGGPGQSGPCLVQMKSAESRSSPEQNQDQTPDQLPVPVLDLDSISGPEDLEALGLNVLKEELMRRGLKCGGTLSERAHRLYSVKGKSDGEVEPSLRAKSKKRGK